MARVGTSTRALGTTSQPGRVPGSPVRAAALVAVCLLCAVLSCARQGALPAGTPPSAPSGESQPDLAERRIEALFAGVWAVTTGDAGERRRGLQVLQALSSRRGTGGTESSVPSEDSALGDALAFLRRLPATDGPNRRAALESARADCGADEGAFRAVMAGVLGRGAPVSPEDLTTALACTDATTRRWAAIGLARLGDGRAIDEVRAALSDSDAWAVAWAARGLEGLQPISLEAASDLLRALADCPADSPARPELQHAVETVAPDAVARYPELAQGLAGPPSRHQLETVLILQAAGTSARAHAAALQELAACTPDPTIRASALWALGSVAALPGDREGARAALRGRLHGPDAVLRGSVADALAFLGDPAGLPVLVEELGAAGPPDQPAALAAIGLLWERGIDAAEAVVPLLASPSSEVRAEAARVLGGMGRSCSAGGAELQGLLHDPDPLARTWAASALAIRGDESAVDTLVAQTLSSGTMVRAEATRALLALQPPPSRVVEAARRLAVDASRGVSAPALVILLRAGDSSQADAVADSLTGDWGRACPDGDRLAAAMALDAVGVEAGRATMRELAAGPSWHVRELAEAALAEREGR